MHLVDSGLERLEVSRYRYTILIECLDFDISALDVWGHIVFICFHLDQFGQGAHVEFLP